VQDRCRFKDGEVRVVTLESEPMAGSPTRGKQRYAIYDAASGLVEEGYVRVADMVGRQPWLDESFDFPVDVIDTGVEPAEPAVATAPAS
jgi:hypothetical protein